MRTTSTCLTMTHTAVPVNGTKNREHIESVELYWVFPAEHNGQTVECAWTWIDSGAVMLGQRQSVKN